MKHIFFTIITLFFSLAISSQVTFVVNDLPDHHNYDNSIYISGDFEGWTGGNKDFKLTKTDKSYSITVPVDEDIVLYKFTLGNWDSVERDKDGTQIDNRIYKRASKKDTIYVKIDSWEPKDLENQTTASKNVSVISENFKIPQLNRDRRVWMYLPPNYKNSNESYPVLYMLDGQNLFDKTTSYSGEWEVDETLNKLFDLYNFKLIVVGIDNGGDKRLDEYSPWKNTKYGGGEGDATLEFVVNTLKPYIDKNYKTLTNRESTGIMGSSMGGLMSHYAALKYFNVFGKAGVYSPAFWFAKDDINTFSKTSGTLKDTQLYFLAGGKEGQNISRFEISQTVKDMNGMIDLLKSAGFPETNIKSKVVPEGEHNEALWRDNFEEAILWLFPKAKHTVRTFVNAFQESNNQLKIAVSDGDYRIKFYNHEIVETSFIPNGEGYDDISHAVVLKPEKISTTYLDSKDKLSFSSSGISVNIQKKPFKISYTYQGKEITSENNGYRKIDDLETIQFNLTDDEILYGAGARALGMNRRGNRLQLYNKAHYGYETRSELMNYTMPIVISSKQYLIHFDNAPIGYLDLDSNDYNSLVYETISGRKAYQIVVGKSWKNLVDNYTDLTGKQPMPPRWALGNFASRFGYHSQAETEAVIKKFKDEEIPVDAVILDLYWFGKKIKGTMGNLEVYKDSFPDMKGMISKFKNQGVHTVLVTEPFIVNTSSKWDEAVNKDILAKDSIGNPATYDFYFGTTGLIDIYKPEAKQWFWNIYRELANQGIAGIWGDLGEPEVHPSWVQHHTGKADQVHNIYGHDWAKLVSQGYQKDFPNKRPFILMRAGYSGTQRFGMIPWSGDVNRTWGGLQSQPEIALQMGMQGLSYMHSDLGGFAGANLDDELYVRWLQYGVFQPIYRPHAQEEVPSEPIFRSDKAKALAKKAIQLRYKLLPYNYNLVFENNQHGFPFMRPLFFEEANNEDLFEYSASYLWGNDFLVSPILEPGKKTQDVYFPKYYKWFDFYSEEIIKGGQTKSVLVSQENIPTYVRAGAFIPMAKLIQTTSKYNGSDLILHYYHDASIQESKRTLYNDDGLTANALEKGSYELLEFKAEACSKELVIEFETKKRGGNFESSAKQIELIIHNISNAPKYLKVDKKKVTYNWDEISKKVIFSTIWNSESRQEVKLKFGK